MEKNYNFLEREKHWQEFWQKEEIYKFDPKAKGEIFSIDTPPPYVSAAHLHVGHAMSYTQAEFVVRYMRMNGYNVFYPMGFDDNGLPTERYVEKKHKIDKSKISREDFVKLCKKETEEGGKVYRDLFKSLGISVDWSLLYTTISEHSQRTAQRSFIDLYKKGLLARKDEPVIWCPFCQTALSQADLDDEESKTKLNYIKFKFDDGSDALIATTRPELIPACAALYVNSNDKRYKKYIGKKAIVPIFNYEVPIMADDEVDLEYGTGLMQVCTWGDTEDIKRWKDDKLETREAITPDGKMTKLAGKYAGMKIAEARKTIIDDLEKEGLLTKQEDLEHTRNVHERCKTVAEYIQTPQWFINVVDQKKTWDKRGKEIKWYPQFMKTKYDAWVEGLKWEWCISRQRYYGVPFPVWYCADCNEVLLPEDKDLPVDPREQKDVITECSKCGSKNINAEEDVMDTWMTSSVTPFINAFWQESKDKNLMEKIYPMTLRIQAFEIIRTWLFYTVVKSHYHTDSLPWRDVMISGWGLDEKGKKMSKSLGNFVEPEGVIEKYSADALRYWAAGANLGQNIRYVEEEVKVGKRTIIKIWNASRFVFSHLEDYKHSEKFDIKKLHSEDKWLLHNLQEVLANYHKNFSEYEYSRAKEKLDRFFWHDLADYYLEMAKHRLYNPDQYGADSREAAQWTLYTVLLAVIKMYAPLMPYITEEVYQSYFAGKESGPSTRSSAPRSGSFESIHLSQMPQVDKKMIDKKLAEEFSDVVDIIAAVRKYKTEKQISMKKEIGKMVIDSKNKELEKYFDLIKAVMSINEVEFGKAEVEVNKDVKIKFD